MIGLSGKMNDRVSRPLRAIHLPVHLTGSTDSSSSAGPTTKADITRPETAEAI